MVIRRDRSPTLPRRGSPQQVSFTIEYAVSFERSKVPTSMVAVADGNSRPLPSAVDYLVTLHSSINGQPQHPLTGLYRSPIASLQQFNGWARSVSDHMATSLQVRLFQALRDCFSEANAQVPGSPLAERPMDLKKRIEKREKRRRKNRIPVKRGAREGSKQSKVTISKRDLEVRMPSIISELLNRDERPTRGRVAQLLGLSNAKALDRLRELYHDHRRWSIVVDGE